MELKYYGANCVKIITKKVSIVVDSTTKDSSHSLKISDKDVVIRTNKVFDYNPGGYFTVDSPGEYEVSEVSITAIQSKLHLDPTKSSLVCIVHVAGFSIAIIGHTIGDITDEQLEKLGVVDIMVIPVGGNGYTLDAIEATKLIKQVEPKIVIPTHYAAPENTYEVPQNSIDDFLKAVGATEVERVESLKLKDGSLPEKTQVIPITPQ